MIGVRQICVQLNLYCWQHMSNASILQDKPYNNRLKTQGQRVGLAIWMLDGLLGWLVILCKEFTDHFCRVLFFLKKKTHALILCPLCNVLSS